jgi:flagella basal body P-ring formation protein FlgA
MRARLWSLLLAACVPALPACAAEPDWTLRADAVPALREALAEGAARLLQGNGWRLDAAQATLRTSRPPEPGLRWQVRPQWMPGAARPVLPLAFELVPVDAAVAPLQAWLAAPLRREVLVLTQAAPRGAGVRCEHTATALRAANQVPAGALSTPCALDAEAVARRPLGAGDVLRASDVGPAPGVAAQAEVRLRVRVGLVVVETPGVSLAEARTGEQVLVRLAHGRQAVRGTVVAPNVVELAEQQ